MIDPNTPLLFVGDIAIICILNILYTSGSKRYPSKIFSLPTDASLHFILLSFLLVYILCFWFSISTRYYKELISIFELLCQNFVPEGSSLLKKWGWISYFVFVFSISPLLKWPAAYLRITRQIPIVEFAKQPNLIRYIVEGLRTSRLPYNHFQESKPDLESPSSLSEKPSSLTTAATTTTTTSNPFYEPRLLLIHNSRLRRLFALNRLTVQWLYLASIAYYLEYRPIWQTEVFSIWWMLFDCMVLALTCGFLVGWVDVVVNVTEAWVDSKEAQRMTGAGDPWDD